MSCLQTITANITNNCDLPPIAGIEQVVYVIERKKLIASTSVSSNLIDELTKSAPATIGYKIQGYNKSSNAGFDLVVSDTEPDRYTQFFSMVAWGIDADTVEALNDIDDIVVIVENKNKGDDGNGAFEVYGLDTGLWKTSFTKRSNDNGGTFVLEFASKEGQAPTRSHYVYYDTSYTVSKAALDLLLVDET